MSFHRSCCDKIPEGECFPYGMDVSFLDLYNDTGGDCGDCPIDGGCTGAFIELSLIHISEPTRPY